MCQQQRLGIIVAHVQLTQIQRRQNLFVSVARPAEARHVAGWRLEIGQDAFRLCTAPAGPSKLSPE